MVMEQSFAWQRVTAMLAVLPRSTKIAPVVVPALPTNVLSLTNTVPLFVTPIAPASRHSVSVNNAAVLLQTPQAS